MTSKCDPRHNSRMHLNSSAFLVYFNFTVETSFKWKCFTSDSTFRKFKNTWVTRWIFTLRKSIVMMSSTYAKSVSEPVATESPRLLSFFKAGWLYHNVFIDFIIITLIILNRGLTWLPTLEANLVCGLVFRY